MQFQVISRDEYGQTAILGTHNDISEAVGQIRKEVTSMNFDNALTTENKFASIDAYSVDFIDEDGEVRDDAVYMGNTLGGTHRFVNPLNGDISDADNSELRIYIGEMGDKEDKVNYYMEDHLGQPLDTFEGAKNQALLSGKTYFFVKGI